MDKNSVLSAVAEHDVQLIRFLYCDNGGTIRGKATYHASLADRMESGIGLTVAMQAMSSLDQLQESVDGMGPVGEVRLMPDPSTFQVLPYAPKTAAMLTTLITLDGEPWAACPRSFLERMDRAARDAGFRMQASIENEFSLLDSEGRPADDTLCFSSVGMLTTQEMIPDLAAQLAAQGITLEQYYPELAHGQHEISVRHRPVLEAGDQQIYVRETIRAVARQHGFAASFAPKPFLDQAGNGGHVHFSAVNSAEAGQHVFFDGEDPYHLSPLGYHFMGGVLRHLPGLLALTTPTVNSYQRLTPGTWSSGYACWGPDNREAPLRIASPMRSLIAESVNVEFKPADLASNPYLVLGGIIAAGLDGLRQAIDPGPPVLVNPARLTGHERQSLGIRRLPTTLDEALDALEHDAVLTGALGGLLTESYLAVKRSEAEFYRAYLPDEVARLHHFRY